MSEVVIKVDNVGKKFCKSLKRSMIYGTKDIINSVLGVIPDSSKLREGEFWALDDVFFEIKKGETVGIIGPNGSGKSTMLKMLNGIFMPDKGRIDLKGTVGALIEVGAGFHPMLSGRENIYINGAILGMTKKELDKKFDSIVAFADIGDFLDAPVKHYSSGMYVRLGFAIAVHCEPEILLVDEVLAVGDSGFQTKCFNEIGKLKERGTTTILVSHNMHAVSTFAEKVVLINKGRATYFADVAEGIGAYNRLFVKSQDESIEKICTETTQLKFTDVRISSQEIVPGDSFIIELNYEAQIDYDDIEVDTGIYTSNEMRLHFQATNHTYDKRIDFKKGKHALKIEICDIKANNSIGTIAIAIWKKNRTEQLFWWRIPVNFKGIPCSMGNNFLNTTYVVD